MSKGKGQQVMENNWFPLGFQLPDGKDTLQTAQKCDQLIITLLDFTFVSERMSIKIYFLKYEDRR